MPTRPTTLAFAIGLYRVLIWLTTVGGGWAESVLGTQAHTSLTVLAWMLSVAAGLGIIVGSVFLMPAVTALVASFFVDDIAAEVEHEHYPGEPAGEPLHAGPLVWDAARRS